MARFIVVIGMTLLLHQNGWANTHSAFNGHVLSGDCQLSKDPMAPKTRVWPALCTNLEAGSEISLRQDQADLNVGLNYARLYTGIHINHFLSMHGEGLRRRLYYLQSEGSAIIKDEKITEGLFIQAGNRALTRFSFALGRLNMPIGTDHRPQMQIFDITIRNESYWNYPDYVANLTFDNQVDSRIEVAYGSNDSGFAGEAKQRNERSENKSTKRKKVFREALSIRTSYDLSALEGTRLAFSLYEERERPRRFGVSISNRGSNDRKSAFEWIRVGTIHKPDRDFSQLFRLTHATGFRAGNRTNFEFELDHRSYRIVTLGFDRKIIDEVILRSAATYFWQDNAEDENRLLISLGLQARL